MRKFMDKKFEKIVLVDPEEILIDWNLNNERYEFKVWETEESLKSQPLPQSTARSKFKDEARGIKK